VAEASHNDLAVGLKGQGHRFLVPAANRCRGDTLSLDGLAREKGDQKSEQTKEGVSSP
jgi:hypothetical protein